MKEIYTERNLLKELKNIGYFFKIVVILMLGMSIGIIFRENVYAYDEIVVVIDPGHGGTVEIEDGEGDANSGAYYNGIMEKDINLATARALKEELEKYSNVLVYMTRDDDVEVSLDARVDYAASVNADIIVSVHYNASGEHNLFGSEIFTSAFGENYATGRGLAECIMSEWEDYGNLKKDIKTRIGNKGTDYYGLIRHGTEKNIPTIILEHGYIDNDKDFQRLKSDEVVKQMGILDATGVAKYYGIEKDVVKAEIIPTVKIEVPDEPVMPDDTEPVGVKLEIDRYNFDKGIVEFTLYAYDDESRLMYYGFEQCESDDAEVFKELEVWNGENGKMSGVYRVTPGYEGPLTATVFNVYQLNSNSPTVTLTASSLEDTDTDSENTDMDNNTENSQEEAVDEQMDDANEEAALDDNNSTSKSETFEIGAAGTRTRVDSGYYNEKDSYVKRSLTRFLIIALIFAIIVAVLIVVVVYMAVEESNKRRKIRQNEDLNRKGRSWIDDEY